MLDWLKRSLIEYLTSAGHLLLLLLAWQMANRTAWLVCLALIAGISTLAWLGTFRRYRAICDTPTSRIGSAAQGFVELVGTGHTLPDRTVYSPSTLLPCLWYRYKAYREVDNKWVLSKQGESDEDFLLDDGSGRCILRPYAAEVHCDRKDTYRRDGMKYEEEVFLAGERLYALGSFDSQGGQPRGLDSRTELDVVLTEWKQEPENLHRNFDLDENGTLDPEEWRLAVQAAKREANRRQRETPTFTVAHSLEKPGHGRPYLISNSPPERLARRYRYWAWGHGATLIAALTTLAFLLGKAS